MGEQEDQQEKAAPACLMTIFGATGDLTKRLLLPSICNLIIAKALPDGFCLLGVAVEDWSDDKFREHITESLRQFRGADVDAEVVNWLTKRARYQQANFDDPAAFGILKKRIEQIEKEGSASGKRLFYLAVAPGFIGPVTTQLSKAGLVNEEGERWRRLVIEKPFGHDVASAVALNAELQKSLREDQIYRIDHFAGKDTVQDLGVFRFSNAIIEPLWTRAFVENVQITMAETVGVEGRAGYYEKSGALRDMVPNHAAELLSLIAMEPPASFSAEHLRDQQVEVLAAIKRMKAEDVEKFAVRGQYGAGVINGVKLPAYRAEPNINPESNTDTYVAMRVEIENERWSGVPFYLRTGKRMTSALTEIAVTFRELPANLFPNARQNRQSANQFLFNLQPAQEIRLSFSAKAPGLSTVVCQESMNFRFAPGPFGDQVKGYERLLHDVMMGNSTLFQRAEFVEEGWRMVQPLLEAWQTPPSDPFPNYTAGSAGPKAADDLLAASGHVWRSLVG